MSHPRDEALDAALDAAELAYCRARGRGDLDPVVKVTRMDPEAPDWIEIAVWSRVVLINTLPQRCRGVAEMLQDGADADDLLTIVVQTWNGMTVIDRHGCSRGCANKS
ncbi:hypothetical protein SAMN05444166_8083 [Singulisphaera sp. GP187]|nr:hypothetical protein SAMN05444166_8083 [Singulisphaera sp. GP187]